MYSTTGEVNVRLTDTAPSARRKRKRPDAVVTCYLITLSYCEGGSLPYGHPGGHPRDVLFWISGRRHPAVQSLPPLIATIEHPGISDQIMVYIRRRKCFLDLPNYWPRRLEESNPHRTRTESVVAGKRVPRSWIRACAAENTVPTRPTRH